MNYTYRAAIFDMDGLLFDTERIYSEMMRYAAAEFDYEISDEVIQDCKGTNDKVCKEILTSRFGANFPVHTIYRLHKQYTFNVFSSSGAPLKPGVREIFDILDEFEIPKAIATSTEKAVAAGLLENAGLHDCFDARVFGDQVEKGKPEPEIFLEAAKRLGINPSKCVVFEDSNNGIKAALKAGMRPVLIPDMFEPPTSVKNMAYKVYADLLEAGNNMPFLLA